MFFIGTDGNIGDQPLLTGAIGSTPPSATGTGSDSLDAPIGIGSNEQTSTSENAEGGFFGLQNDSRVQVGIAAAKGVFETASKYNPLQGVSSVAQVSSSSLNLLSSFYCNISLCSCLESCVKSSQLV